MFFWSLDAGHTSGTQTDMQAKHHTIRNSKKGLFLFGVQNYRQKKVSLRRQMIGWGWWYKPLLTSSWEAEAGESL